MKKVLFGLFVGAVLYDMIVIDPHNAKVMNKLRAKVLSQQKEIDELKRAVLKTQVWHTPIGSTPRRVEVDIDKILNTRPREDAIAKDFIELFRGKEPPEVKPQSND